MRLRIKNINFILVIICSVLMLLAITRFFSKRVHRKQRSSEETVNEETFNEMKKVKKKNIHAKSNRRRKGKRNKRRSCRLSEQMKKLNEVNRSDVVRVILVTYFRSGSSFLGDLLQQKHLSFYSFEPLRYIIQGSRIPKSRVTESLNVVDKILNCEFNKIQNYVSQTKKIDYFKGKVYKDFCGDRPVNTKLLTAVCKRCKMNVIKLTRLNFTDAATYLKNTKYSNVKLVHLVRDPRAIYNSRKSFAWCRKTDCIDVKHLCAEMLDDFKASQNLMQQFPGK
ncbi:carbohydrate sulfotransferase 3-like protein, partial [Leptotrombidium deliense]